MTTRRVLATVVVAMVVLTLYIRLHPKAGRGVDVAAAGRATCVEVGRAFSSHRSHLWLTLAGTVARELPDARGFRTHQRFIVACSTGHTILIVNDVDVGQRVPVKVGDLVSVRGEYVWNHAGGLVHFTHHDPSGGESGWIVVHGRAYALRLVPSRPHRTATHDPVFA